MMPEGLSFSLRVSLRRSEKFFGPGVASLLRLVERTGSLQTAAAEMQMSYSKAWKIIRKAEGELDAAQRLFTECFEGGDTNETD